MDQRIFVGVDLAKRFHQVAAVDASQQLVAEPFTIGRGRDGRTHQIGANRIVGGSGLVR